MDGIRKATTTASSSRYWQVYPPPALAEAYERREVSARVEPRDLRHREERERHGIRSAHELSRPHPLDQRHEIRATTRVRDPPPLVPTAVATKRESGHVFEQQMVSHGFEHKVSVNHVFTAAAPLHRNFRHLESSGRHQWKCEPIDRPHAPPNARPRVFDDLEEHKPHPQEREEIDLRGRADTRRHEPSRQQGSQYWVGRIKEEPRVQAQAQAAESSRRYLPAQRLLPSLMERRSLSSLSDTSIPSPRLESSPDIAPRLVLNHKGLFTQARREFPVPRFSFPVDSPSLFSVVGPLERPTASANALLTGRTAKVLASVASPPLKQSPRSPNPPNPKKKVRRTRVCTIEGCVKLVVDHGVCIRHGGGKRCNVEGCECRAQNRGLCWKHGGYTICTVDGCAKRAKSRGMCWSHGGGTQCKQEDCSKIAVSRGRCWAHGGGKRCKVPNCQKPAALRLDDYCSEHHSKSKRLAMGHSTSFP